jgi:hypothetical protein
VQRGKTENPATLSTGKEGFLKQGNTS